MCCGCRKRFTPTHLFRLQIHPETQQLFVVPLAKKVHGRSAWVCWDTSCIHAIVKHPKKIHQSLRSATKTNHLLQQIYEELWQRYHHILDNMRKDGVISIHQTQPSSETISLELPLFTSVKTNQQSIDGSESPLSQDSTDQWISFTSSHHQQESLHKTVRLLEQIKNG